MRPQLHATGFGALLALLLATSPATAQVVQGTVTEDGSKTPIPTVEVVLVDAAGTSIGQAVSDTLGAFQIVAPVPGEYTLRVSRIGYATETTAEFEVERGEVVVVEVSMSTVALKLEPLVVVERRRERNPMLARFHERAEITRRSGLGRVYYREEMRGIGSVYNLYMVQSGTRSCPMMILVDNLPVEDPRELDFLAQIDRVEGVEIYRRQLQIPSEYTHLRACSLMLVWTRQPVGQPFSLKRLIFAGAAAAVIFLLAR
jgi:hypothetical protein